MLFHYSVPRFICRKELSFGFDQRTKVGVDRFSVTTIHHLVLILSIIKIVMSITTIHHLVLILFTLALHLEVERSRDPLLGCIKTEVSGTFSLHCICLSPADAYFMRQFHEKRIAANFQNSKCLMHSFGQFFTFKAQLLQKESRNSARI